MQTITVRKEDLLTKLHQNREDHRAIFEEALEGFRTKVLAELEDLLQKVRDNKDPDIRFVRTVPVDHTRDYDRAIAMVVMDVRDTIELDEQDFARYVQDDWGWQGSFLSNVYGSPRASAKFGDSYVVS